MDDYVWPRKYRNEAWSILELLAALSEFERRRILRSHMEVGFELSEAPPRRAGTGTAELDRRDIELRHRLDAALIELTLIEIGFEVGLLAEIPVSTAVVGALRSLFGSDAFFRYASAYMYFGVRLLAGRILHDPWQAVRGQQSAERMRSYNKPTFALLDPPTLEDEQKTRRSMDWLNALVASDDAADARPMQIEITAALRFLDGFIVDFDEPAKFELWLRQLFPSSEYEPRFTQLRVGMEAWIANVTSYFEDYLPPDPPIQEVSRELGRSEESNGRARPIGGWRLHGPLVARFGLAHVYWIARILGAEVSATGTVVYRNANFIRLLRERADLERNRALQEQLWRSEEILRSALDMTCDLIQISVEITEEAEKIVFEFDPAVCPPSETVKWREAFDEELGEINRQRRLRMFEEIAATPPMEIKASSAAGQTPIDLWPVRVWSEQRVNNLIGLAFSGGGIRSATFGLGVLQGLKERDLLRHVDLLSSVSGGGFIASWLAASGLRTPNFLAKAADWADSIAHLRRYSNYLSPRSGILSADFWTMWAIWLRNALLIQLTGLAWTLFLFLLALIAHGEFPQGADTSPIQAGIGIAVSAIFAVIVFHYLRYNLKEGRTGQDRAAPTTKKKILICVILSAWIAAFFHASLLWRESLLESGLHFSDPDHIYRWNDGYSAILHSAWYAWSPWLVCIFVAFCLFGMTALKQKQIVMNIFKAVGMSLFCMTAFYLLLCAVARLFICWAGMPAQCSWFALVFGPGLVMTCYVVAVLLFIGLTGRDSDEPTREWWTRIWTWLGIFGAVYLILASAAVFAPSLFIWVDAGHYEIKWGAILGWICTVIGGLISGSSSKTNGEGGGGTSIAMEWLAKAGGVLFIAGAANLASVALYMLLCLMAIDSPAPWSCHWSNLNAIGPGWLWGSLGVALICGILFSWRFEINIFGLSQFYRSRLARCYLGATRWFPGVRKPQPFTDFDKDDDLRIAELRSSNTNAAGNGIGYAGPFPIYNCSLNLGGSSDLTVHTRHSACFTLTPFRCGADRPRVGYAPTVGGTGLQFAGGVPLGQAIAVSGAAASPNMGYNTSPVVAFLLTMFNVRLGWWYPNPGKQKWHKRGLPFTLFYLMNELFGLADEKKPFVNVSDGGHFENLAIYEMIRRRCKLIIASDAECDEELGFGGLGNLVRICETDFGAKVDIDVRSIRKNEKGLSSAHCTVGKITYSTGSIGYLIYLKSSITGDEPLGVAQYHSSNPSFPHQSTVDQFFSEDQFDSYRQLGLHIVEHMLRGTEAGDHPIEIAERLMDVTAPVGSGTEAFLRHTRTLAKIWVSYRNHAPFPMPALMRELLGNPQGPIAPTNEDILLAQRIFQLMEDVFLDMRLDDFWDHPDNRGWAILFTNWARSPLLRAIWTSSRRNYGIRFEYFCDKRLGLPRERPIARVSRQ